MGELIHQVGKLCLLLDEGDERIECCVGLCAGEDPYNAADMSTYAEAFCVAVAGVLKSTFTISDWRSKNPEGDRAAEGTLPTIAVGTHGTDSGTPAYASLRGHLGGKTAFPTGDFPAGQTHMYVPLRNTFAGVARTKAYAPMPDSDWEDLRMFLQGNGALWSDFYGRKAMVRNRLTIQFNAYIQQRDGS